MNQADWMNQQAAMQQNAYAGRETPEQAISRAIRDIDAELARFSEERKQLLLAERARLLRAQEALGVK